MSAWFLARFLVLLLLGRLSERSPPLRFSAEGVRRLRDALRTASQRPDLTANTALTAHLTHLCLRLHRIPAGTPCEEVTVMDIRERFAGVPPEFTGNAAYLLRSPTFAAETEPGELARVLHDGLAPFVTRPSAPLADHVVLACDLLRTGVRRLPYDAAAAYAKRPTSVYVNSFVRMPVYDVDFGESGRPRRPVYVIPHDLPDPVILWPAPPERGGVEVYLTAMQARGLRRLSPDDSWWSELRAFEDGSG